MFRFGKATSILQNFTKFRAKTSSNINTHETIPKKDSQMFLFL